MQRLQLIHAARHQNLQARHHQSQMQWIKVRQGGKTSKGQCPGSACRGRRHHRTIEQFARPFDPPSRRSTRPSAHYHVVNASAPLHNLENHSPTNAVSRSTILISEINLSLFSRHSHTNTSLTRQTHAHTQHAHARICCTRQHMQTRHSHDTRTRTHTQPDNTHVRRTRARPYSPTNVAPQVSYLNLCCRCSAYTITQTRHPRHTHAYTQHAHARVCCTRQHMQTRHSHDRRTRTHTQRENTHVRHTRTSVYAADDFVYRKCGRRARILTRLKRAAFTSGFDTF